MSKFIKPPSLSTNFLESGKSAKKRFDNILNTKAKKTGFWAFVLILALAGIACAMVARSNTDNQAETAKKYVMSHGYKIVSGDKAVQPYVLTNENLVIMPYSMYWGFLEFDEVDKCIGKQVVTYQFTVTNHPLDNADNNTKKQTKLWVMVCDNQAVGGYSLPDYSESVSGGVYSFDGRTLEEVKGMDFLSWQSLWKERYGSVDSPKDRANIDRAVSSAILKSNANSYGKGECVGEGHVILGTVDSKGWYSGDEGTKIEAYVLATYGEYGFENGNFTKISGSGVIPTLITFEVFVDGRYNLLEYKPAEDGGGYAPSIKEMFPEKYWSRALSTANTDYNECKKQEKVYADDYLKSINRVAKIVDSVSVSRPLSNMNVDVSNKLGSMYAEYPYWIGTQEKTENSMRYVYEKQWDDKGNGNGIVTFKKYEFDSKKVAQETVIEINNGDMVYLKGTPREENYSKYN